MSENDTKKLHVKSRPDGEVDLFVQQTVPWGVAAAILHALDPENRAEYEDEDESARQNFLRLVIDNDKPPDAS